VQLRKNQKAIANLAFKIRAVLCIFLVNNPYCKFIVLLVDTRKRNCSKWNYCSNSPCCICNKWANQSSVFEAICVQWQEK